MNDGEQTTGTAYRVMRRLEVGPGTWEEAGEYTATGDRAAKKMARADIRAAEAKNGTDHGPLELVAIPARSFKAETSTPQLTQNGALIGESWS